MTTMYSAIESKFADALAKHALIFTPSTEVRKKLSSGVDVIYTYAPALAKKPTNQDNKQASGEDDKQKSPWLPPDEALVVEKLPKHTIVLNKFAVAKYHFLLVTNEFQKQNLPLSEDDWEAAMDVLKKANRESGKRHVGFFNSGEVSGASVSHRHIQFVTLPDHFSPFPDTTRPSDKDTLSYADNRVPFTHFITRLPQNASTDDVLQQYSELLGRVLTKISLSRTDAVRPSVSYNLVFTEEWIIATPRSAECTKEGISINSLGTIGLILAKSEEQLKVLEERNLDLIAEVGFPFEDVAEHAPDHTGYTHY